MAVSGHRHEEQVVQSYPFLPSRRSGDARGQLVTYSPWISVFCFLKGKARQKYPADPNLVYTQSAGPLCGQPAQLHFQKSRSDCCCVIKLWLQLLLLWVLLFFNLFWILILIPFMLHNDCCSSSNFKLISSNETLTPPLSSHSKILAPF